MSKGSQRRPGIVPPDAWNRIFHPDKCATCGELKAKCGCVVVRREKGDQTAMIRTVQQLMSDVANGGPSEPFVKVDKGAK